MHQTRIVTLYACLSVCLTLILSWPRPGAGHFSRYVARSWWTCSNTRYRDISLSRRGPWQMSSSLWRKEGNHENALINGCARSNRDESGPDFSQCCRMHRSKKVKSQHCTGCLICSWTWVEFECSTVCRILPGLMGIWQKPLVSWWNTQIKVNPSHVHEEMGHPVLGLKEIKF